MGESVTMVIEDWSHTGGLIDQIFKKINSSLTNSFRKYNNNELLKMN